MTLYSKPSAGEEMDIVPFGAVRTWKGPGTEYPFGDRQQESYEPQKGGTEEPQARWIISPETDENACNIGVEWDEPRLFKRIEITLTDSSAMPAPEQQQVEIWCSKGESVWPSWANVVSPWKGVWRRIQSQVEIRGATAIHKIEVPKEGVFKVRLVFKCKHRVAVKNLAVYSSTRWREASCRIEWGCGGESEQVWNGHLEAFNGEILSVETLLGKSAKVMEDFSWRSITKAGVTDGVLVRFLMADTDRDSPDRTILTFRSQAYSFSFLARDLEEDEAIYVKPYHVLVSWGDSGLDWKTVKRKLKKKEKTIRELVKEMPEQTLENAMRALPEKKRNRWFALAPSCNANKFVVEPDGTFYGWAEREPTGPIFSFRRADAPDVEIEPQQHQERGYLPILISEWKDGSIFWEQTYVSTHLKGVDIPDKEMEKGLTALLVRIRAQNKGAKPVKARLLILVDCDRNSFGHHYLPKRLENGFYLAGEGDGIPLAYLEASRGEITLREKGNLLYSVVLQPGENAEAELRVPYLGSFVGLSAALEDYYSYLANLGNLLPKLKFEEVYAATVDYWENYLSKSMQIHVPDNKLNEVWRSFLIHQWNYGAYDPWTKFYLAKIGVEYPPYGNESTQIAKALDMFGRSDLAEKYLEPFCTIQGSTALKKTVTDRIGNPRGYWAMLRDDFRFQQIGSKLWARVTDDSGALIGFINYYVFNTGFILWNACVHYWFTRDKGWLRRMAPYFVKACDWIAKQRKTTMKRDSMGRKVLGYGFFPPCGLEDETAWYYWTMSNAYLYKGMKTAAEVLADIDHPDAKRIAREAEIFKKDLLEGIREATIRCPVVKLRDGTYIPYVPKHLHRRGRGSIGKQQQHLYEAELGALHLVTCDVIEPGSEMVTWILDFLEDVVFLTPVEDTFLPFNSLVSDCFNLGGFGKTQPYLLHEVQAYVRRDEPEFALRSFYNKFAAQSWSDINVFPEHIIWYGATSCKTYEEAMWLQQFRSLLIQEEGESLWLCKAASREWFEDGKEIRVDNAPTYFGPMSYRIVSQTKLGRINATIDPPIRNPPKEIILRLRHPERMPMRTVTVNGKPHADFNPEKEFIRFTDVTEKIEIKVTYQ